MKSSQPFFQTKFGLACLFVGISAILFLVVLVYMSFSGDSGPPGKVRDIKTKEWSTYQEKEYARQPNRNAEYAIVNDEAKPSPKQAEKPATTAVQPGSLPPVPENRTEKRRKPVPPLRIYAEKNVQTFEEEQLELAKKKTVPYGRLLKCRLVNAVDSSNLQTPVIGLVEEDLIWAGQVIIPKNTEVHGMAQGATPTRDRIGCGPDWKLVLMEPKYNRRRELDLKCLALDANYNAEHDTWAITDGSAGLRGTVIDTTESKEFKLFMAAFLSGMSSSFRDTTTSEFGTVQIMPNARNATLGGMSEVMNEYARTIREAIRRDGVFVRCTGNKEFYLYVQQTIDLDQARINAAPEPKQKR